MLRHCRLSTPNSPSTSPVPGRISSAPATAPGHTIVTNPIPCQYLHFGDQVGRHKLYAQHLAGLDEHRVLSLHVYTSRQQPITLLADVSNLLGKASRLRLPVLTRRLGELPRQVGVLVGKGGVPGGEVGVSPVEGLDLSSKRLRLLLEAMYFSSPVLSREGVVAVAHHLVDSDRKGLELELGLVPSPVAKTRSLRSQAPLSGVLVRRP